MKKKIFKSEAFAAIHASATALHKVGAIDKATMRDFDLASLSSAPEFSANEIQKLRKRHHVSQPVFARYLNVTNDYVSKWERGEKKPAGPSLKLLSLIERHGLEAIA